MAKNCFGCGVSLEKKRRSEYREVNNTIFCLKCYRNKTRLNQRSDENPNVEANTYSNAAKDDTKITLLFSKTNVSYKKCILCERSDRVLKRLSRDECIEVYINSTRNLFVPYGARVCSIDI